MSVILDMNKLVLFLASHPVPLVKEVAKILMNLSLIPGSMDVVLVSLQPDQQEGTEQGNAPKGQCQEHGPRYPLGSQTPHPSDTHSQTDSCKLARRVLPYPLQQAGPQGKHQQGAAEHGEGVQSPG